MKLVLIAAASAAVLSFGAVSSVSAQSVNPGSVGNVGNLNNVNSGDTSKNVTSNNTNNENKSKTFNAPVGNTTTDDSTHISLGNVDLNLPSNTNTYKAENRQTLNNAITGNNFNYFPTQAAEASSEASSEAAKGGNGGDSGGGGGGGGDGRGSSGGSGGNGGNAAAAAAAQAAAAGSSGSNALTMYGVSIDGAAFQNFSGIMAAAFNTGILSNAQAANGVSANANISFSH